MRAIILLFASTVLLSAFTDAQGLGDTCTLSKTEGGYCIPSEDCDGSMNIGSDLCSEDNVCCNVLEKIPVGESCIAQEGPGICTNVLGCLSEGEQRNCEGGAICCTEFPVEGKPCSINVHVLSLCVNEAYCLDPNSDSDSNPDSVSATCSADLVCCGTLPDIGENCGIDAVCVVSSKYCPSGEEVEGYCSGVHSVCCPVTELPGRASECAIAKETTGFCTPIDTCEDRFLGTFLDLNVCQVGQECCVVKPDVLVGSVCIEVGGARCTTLAGCKSANPVQKNCETGAVCCRRRPGFGEICSIDVMTEGVCVDTDFCNDDATTRVSSTCAGPLTCCGSLPAIGESCAEGAVCITGTECGGGGIVAGTCGDKHAVCCSSLQLPGATDECSSSKTMKGNCVPVDSCGTTHPGTTISVDICQEALECCQLDADQEVGSECLEEKRGFCTTIVGCDLKSGVQRNCEDGAVCCINRPDEHEVCSIDVETNGVCVNRNYCNDEPGERISSTCQGAGIICCTKLPEIGDECKENAVCVSSNECAGDPTEGFCHGSHSVCCPAAQLPDRGDKCYTSETETGYCTPSGECMSPFGGDLSPVQVCKEGFKCCTLPQQPVGSSCIEISESVCTTIYGCLNSDAVKKNCEDGAVCCTDLPVDGQMCTHSIRTRGFCLNSTYCSDDEDEEVTSTCVDPAICCENLPEFGEDCDEDAVCADAKHCNGMETNTNCHGKDAVCCPTESLPGMNDVCYGKNHENGVCVDPGVCEPAGGNVIPKTLCAAERECCSGATEILPKGPGYPCGRYGGCAVDCDDGAVDPDSVGECSSGLTCCVESLNQPCSSVLLPGRRARKCSYPEDCEKQSSFLLLRKKCTNQNLVCC